MSGKDVFTLDAGVENLVRLESNGDQGRNNRAGRGAGDAHEFELQFVGRRIGPHMGDPLGPTPFKDGKNGSRAGTNRHILLRRSLIEFSHPTTIGDLSREN